MWFEGILGLHVVSAVCMVVLVIPGSISVLNTLSKSSGDTLHDREENTFGHGGALYRVMFGGLAVGLATAAAALLGDSTD